MRRFISIKSQKLKHKTHFLLQNEIHSNCCVLLSNAKTTSNTVDRIYLVVVFGGLTFKLQPLDVHINRPFKTAIRLRCYAWFT